MPSCSGAARSASCCSLPAAAGAPSCGRPGATAKPRALAADGLRTLVNHGPGEEALAQEVVAASGGAAQALSCSVSELIALTRRARLFLGGDTGPMHLAAALGVPVVAVFGPTDPARNGPFGTSNVVLRSAASRTSYAHRAQMDPGMLDVRTEEVVAAARSFSG